MHCKWEEIFSQEILHIKCRGWPGSISTTQSPNWLCVSRACSLCHWEGNRWRNSAGWNPFEQRITHKYAGKFLSPTPFGVCVCVFMHAQVLVSHIQYRFKHFSRVELCNRIQKRIDQCNTLKVCVCFPSALSCGVWFPSANSHSTWTDSAIDLGGETATVLAQMLWSSRSSTQSV